MRTINFAHAAAAQQGSETKVPPENCAFMEANCRPAIQQGIAFCVAGEHPLNFRDQAPITATGLIDKVLALGGRKFDGGLEDLADFETRPGPVCRTSAARSSQLPLWHRP